jgi:hypothetical protein
MGQGEGRRRCHVRALPRSRASSFSMLTRTRMPGRARSSTASKATSRLATSVCRRLGTLEPAHALTQAAPHRADVQGPRRDRRRRQARPRLRRARARARASAGACAGVRGREGRHGPAASGDRACVRGGADVACACGTGGAPGRLHDARRAVRARGCEVHVLSAWAWPALCKPLSESWRSQNLCVSCANATESLYNLRECRRQIRGVPIEEA